MVGKDLNATLERLYRRRSLGIRPGIEMTAAILDRLDAPQDAYNVVHIAGTNGKGSVAAMLESVLRSAGVRTALYTSPHLVAFNERFRVNGEAIQDAGLRDLLDAVEEHAAAVARQTGRESTFFEYATVAAFEHFRRENVDLAVIETGMGGRLDATNVVKPVLTIITRIGMDHTMYLGDTVELIAQEKCGIIKPGCPLVSAGMDDDALGVVVRSAAAAGVTHVHAPEAASVRVKSASWLGQKIEIETQQAGYGTLELPLVGRHQVENLATSIVAAEVLSSVAGLSVDKEHVKAGIAAVRWLGRCQVLREEPLLVLDGAHNAGGARALARTFARLSPGCPLGIVVGMCDDKDVREFLAAFPRAGGKLWAVPVPSERSVAPRDMCDVARRLGWEATESDVASALRETREWCVATGGVGCVTGSLFLAGQVLGEWLTVDG